jgi:hypothetical protein
MRVVRPQHYTLVFLAHLATLLVAPFLPAESPAGDLLFLFFFGIIVSALPAARGRPIVHAAFAVLATLLVLGLVGHSLDHHHHLWHALALASAALLFGLLVAMILSDVVRVQVVTMDTVFGAATAYLALGLLWAMLYALLELTVPGSFHGPTAEPHLQDFNYYSYVTLTTTGYGDVVPVSRPARGLAVMEALVGQLYLAVMIARLVSLQTAHEMRNRR